MIHDGENFEPHCVEAGAGIEKEKSFLGPNARAQNQGRLAAPKMGPPFYLYIAKVLNLRVQKWVRRESLQWQRFLDVRPESVTLDVVFFKGFHRLTGPILLICFCQADSATCPSGFASTTCNKTCNGNCIKLHNGDIYILTFFFRKLNRIES
jgi:hypothetical protein